MKRRKPYNEVDAAFGKVAEERIGRILVEQGYAIIPTNKGDDGWPHLNDSLEDLTLPDILAIKNKVLRWVEVKRKDAVPSTVKGTTDFGIELRHYEDYKKVQEITGIPVWLAWCEIGSPRIFYEALDKTKFRAGLEEPQAYVYVEKKHLREYFLDLDLDER